MSCFYSLFQVKYIEKFDINARKNKIFSVKNSLFLADLSSKWWRIYASVLYRFFSTRLLNENYHAFIQIILLQFAKCVVSKAYLRKRICATTCYLNPSEKDCFLAKMSEISEFDSIIFRIFKYIAFR